MRRIKKTDAQRMKNNENNTGISKSKIWLIASAALIVVVVLVLIMVEDSMRCKYVIRNNTDKDIKNIEVVFETGDGQTCSELYLGSVKAGEKVKGKYEPYDFSRIEDMGDMWVYVEFEGSKGIIFTDGMLYTNFDGSVSIDFNKEDGKYIADLDSSRGLFTGSELAGIEAKIMLDLENGDWDYMVYLKSEDRWVIDESMKLEWDDLTFDEIED